jgi:hypothetical protein
MQTGRQRTGEKQYDESIIHGTEALVVVAANTIGSVDELGPRIANDHHALIPETPLNAAMAACATTPVTCTAHITSRTAVRKPCELQKESAVTIGPSTAALSWS